MPDLASEMKKVVNAMQEWDDEPDTLKRHDVALVPTPAPAKAPHPRSTYGFKPTNNVTRELFALIHDNPSKYTQLSACHALHERGFNKASVSSLVGQFLKQFQFGANQDGTLYTKVPEYIPLKAPVRGRVTQTKAFKTSKPVPKSVYDGPKKTVAAPVPPPVQAFVPPLATLTAANVLQTIGIKEAHALYLELHAMFGHK